MTTFDTLHADGTVTNVRDIPQEIISTCPFYILVADHYENGTCKCHNAEYRKMMIREWGYTEYDFRDVSIKVI